MLRKSARAVHLQRDERLPPLVPFWSRLSCDFIYVTLHIPFYCGEKHTASDIPSASILSLGLRKCSVTHRIVQPIPRTFASCDAEKLDFKSFLSGVAGEPSCQVYEEKEVCIIGHPRISHQGQKGTWTRDFTPDARKALQTEVLGLTPSPLTHSDYRVDSTY